VTDFVEMFRHWHAGRSQVQIHQALNIDRKTIRKYLAPALAEGLAPVPDGPFDEALWRERIGRWFPELLDPAVRALTWPQIAVHHRWIAEQLKAPVTVATIAQRLRDDHGVEVSESTVRRYVATAFAEQRLEDKVTVPRGSVEAGSEAQIDYGRLGMWCDPASGRRVAVWVFAMILSCSRALFVQPVLRMDQTSWNASHVAAFEFFGSVPARLVTDYVARHIIGLLCPTALCTRPPEILSGALRMGQFGHITVRGNRASAGGSDRIAKPACCGLPPRKWAARRLVGLPVWFWC